MARVAEVRSDSFAPFGAGWDQVQVLRICQTENGHGVRGLSGRKAFGSASVSMPKLDCPMLTEAGGEHIALKRHLFDARVVKVATQPFRVDLLSGGARSCYFPDFAVLFADGTRMLEEHKASARQLRDPDYVAKLAATRDGFAPHGYGLRVVLGDGSDLGPWERRLRAVRDANVEHMFVSRYVEFGQAQEEATARLLERDGGITTLGRVAAVLDARRPHGRAIAYSMAARRLLDVDLDRPLDDRTVVRSVPPLPPWLPSLRL